VGDRGVEVRAWVAAETKLQAAAALAEVGLSTPEAIRMVLRRVVRRGGCRLRWVCPTGRHSARCRNSRREGAGARMAGCFGGLSALRHESRGSEGCLLVYGCDRKLSMATPRMGKINQRERRLPEGLVADAAWLGAQGYSTALRRQYVGSGRLEQPAETSVTAESWAGEPAAGGGVVADAAGARSGGGWADGAGVAGI